MIDVSSGPDVRSAHDTVGHVWLLGVRIHSLSLEQLLSTIECTILRDERAIIAYVNVHAINLAFDLAWFRAFLNRSELVFCDGVGVRWGVRLLGDRIPHRFTPPDWVADLAETARRRDFTLFFLGARPGVAEKAAVQLERRFPGLRIAGTHHGYFDKAPGSDENEAVIGRINAVQPNILILGFGMPLQERWLVENWDRIDANVALPAGALFDYVSGELPRAPRWMTEHGLEWLGRLLVEPRRLWRRYLIGNPLFLWRVFKQRLGLLRLDDAASPGRGMNFFGRFVDNRDPDSLATRMRRERFKFFLGLLHNVPRPIKILDVGGTQGFWETMGYTDVPGVQVALLNLDEQQVRYESFAGLVADATDLSEIRDDEFDVVFSNSVIEHVGDSNRQRLMAREIRRVGKRYFVQTPNYLFPIEPHFLFPGFQWLPIRARVFLIRNLNLGWMKRIPDPERARELIESVRLLRKGELLALFPGASLYEEKVIGLTKSFVVYGGW